MDNLSQNQPQTIQQEVYDVIIIGSGPAGLTAGLYTSRADLKTLLIAGLKWGGQLMLTTDVENFPGFPDGIMGPELMIAMRKQAEKYGTKIIDTNFSSADYTKRPFEVKTEDGKVYYSKSVIIATGADTKWLQIPGEQEHIGRGVSSCAPCDAAFFRNKKVIVVGGGDSAMEEASVLSKFASEITIAYRGESLRASEIMQKRVKENPKIKIMYNTELTEIVGDGKVVSVKMKSKVISDSLVAGRKNNEDVKLSPGEWGGEARNATGDVLEWDMPLDGVFVAIGHIPNSTLFGQIEKDEKGFMKRFEGSKTNIEGVFVAGDVHDYHYMQAVTAAGYGCEAALSAERWLEQQK